MHILLWGLCCCLELAFYQPQDDAYFVTEEIASHVWWNANGLLATMLLRAPRMLSLTTLDIAYLVKEDINQVE